MERKLIMIELNGIVLCFQGQYYSVARSDILPNWYLAADECEPRIIASTAGEGLTFVAPFDSPSKWKRFDYQLSSSRKQRYDFYDPFTPQKRFEKNAMGEVKESSKVMVTPTPLEVKVDDTVEGVGFTEGEWSISYDAAFKHEAQFLAGRIFILNIVDER
jgi:hexosaminidase